MSITGDADNAPLRVGYPLADTVGGLTAAMAICGALNAEKRGAFIDVSMLESVLATMGWGRLKSSDRRRRPNTQWQ